MRAYQEHYLALQQAVAERAVPQVEELGPEAFMEAVHTAAEETRAAVERGTRLLRENLFPVLDNILSASQEELACLSEFAGRLLSLRVQRDTGLPYRIHLALLGCARRRHDRDMLIRELYQLGMSLYYMEMLLSPSQVRLFSSRMRMIFTECASYYETEYDSIEDPEIRGYIHRAMGNIALSYDGVAPESARAKLAAMDRSIRILSDPDVRAKTPSLPWDVYLYKSHQERTSMLAYLRTGNAEADVFAQVLESSQIIQQRQQKAARERGEPLQPRWQYAYLAAQYHCGALPLAGLLEGLYALHTAGEGSFDLQSTFSHVSVPAYFMVYASELPEGKLSGLISKRIERMTRRLCRYIVQAPAGRGDDQVLLSLRRFLYVYRELPGCMPFFELLQNAFAARHPARYAGMWITGRIARELCAWTLADCPQRLEALPPACFAGQSEGRQAALLDFAETAGRLCDVGMLHFIGLDTLVSRGLFSEEDSLFQLHPHFSAELLRGRESTAAYADVALGHHCRYDEKGGYPLDFSPRSSPMRPMIYLAAVASALSAAARDTDSRSFPYRPLEELFRELEEERGGAYAPFVVDLLQAPARREFLAQALDRWSREAYLDLFHRRAAMLALE